MVFDWITWAVWGIGVLILIFWLIETIKEFKVLFNGYTKKKEER